MIKKSFMCFCAVWLMLTGYVPLGVSASELSVSAKSAVLIDAASGQILFQKNHLQPLSMASTTKIMTALLTLEQKDLYTYFKVDDKAIMTEGTSMGLKQGDSANLYALAVGMLLQSGNDAANVAAVRIGGDIPKFVNMMNQKAKEIGMANTNFVTPSGLDAPLHYSTAYDMAILGAYAIQNNIFKSICSKQKEKVAIGNPVSNRYYTNHNRLLKEYEGAIGIKTGFTKKSGRCLVSAATRDGITLVAVTLNAPNDWDDHKKMLDYGFASVNSVSLKDLTVNINVAGGQKNQITAETVGDLISCTDSNKTKILKQSFYYAPISKGDVLGKVQYYKDEKLLGEKTLVATEDVARKITKVKISFYQRIKMFFENKINKFLGFIKL